MLGALYPLRMPLATLVLPGDDAEDGHIHTIIRARHVTGQNGRLYVEDSKICAWDIRTFVQADDEKTCRSILGLFLLLDVTEMF